MQQEVLLMRKLPDLQTVACDFVSMQAATKLVPWMTEI